MIQQQLKSSIASSAKKHPAGSFIVKWVGRVVRKKDLYTGGNEKCGFGEKRECFRILESKSSAHFSLPNDQIGLPFSSFSLPRQIFSHHELRLLQVVLFSYFRVVCFHTRGSNGASTLIAYTVWFLSDAWYRVFITLIIRASWETGSSYYGILASR